MRALQLRAAAGAAAFALTLCAAVGGATAQVPSIPGPAPSTTVPATSPPSPDETRPTVPDPGKPPPTTVEPEAPAPAGPAGPVPGSPTPTTAPKPAGDSIPPAGPATERPPPFRIDLSEIDALRRQARGKGPRAAQPDFGFDPALPFGPGGELGGASAAAVDARELGAEDEELERIRSTAAVGAGLLALLLAAMGILVSGRARRQRPPGPPGTGRPSRPLRAQTVLNSS